MYPQYLRICLIYWTTSLLLGGLTWNFCSKFSHSNLYHQKSLEHMLHSSPYLSCFGHRFSPYIGILSKFAVGTLESSAYYIKMEKIYSLVSLARDVKTASYSPSFTKSFFSVCCHPIQIGADL